MVTIQNLVARNERDIALFRRHVASLMGKPGTLQYIAT